MVCWKCVGIYALGLSLAALTLLTGAGCADEDGDLARELDPAPDSGRPLSAPTPQAGGAAPTAPVGVSYHRDLRPLIEANCLGCHVEGGAGPFPLDTWSAVSEVAPLVVAAVSSGLMPPWPASPDCRELRDAPTLSDAARASFMEWQLAGFPEGDEADYRPPHSEQVVEDPGEPSLMLSAGGTYTPAVEADDYRCFLLEGATFDHDLYLTGMDILPGQRSEVHHVQIHRVSATQLATVQQLDAASEGVGYPCNGGTGVFSQNLFSYRPGSRGVSFEDGDAVFIAGGSSLLIQVHYNTIFLPQGQAPLPDETKVALWTLPDGALPDHVIYRGGSIAPFTIPAGEPAYLAQTSSPMMNVSAVGGTFGMGGVFVPGEVIGMTPHAHQLASRMSATLIHPDGTTECMIDVPDWDFHWQLDYLYTRGVAFGPDDQLSVTCEYDNSAENQATVDGTRLPPREVGWGEGSLDEMCLHYVWMRYEREAFLEARRIAAANAALAAESQ